MSLKGFLACWLPIITTCLPALCWLPSDPATLYACCNLLALASLLAHWDVVYLLYLKSRFHLGFAWVRLQFLSWELLGYPSHITIDGVVYEMHDDA